MRWFAAAALCAVLAVVAAVLALTYTQGFSYALAPSASWGAVVPATRYLSAPLIPRASWSAVQLPVMAYAVSLIPRASWSAVQLPVTSFSASVRPSWAGAALPFMRLQSWRGGYVEVEAVSGTSLSVDRFFWDGGVWVEAPRGARVVFRGVDRLVAANASVSRVADGYAVDVPPGSRVLVAEPCTVVVELVDPLGVPVLGVDLKAVVEGYGEVVLEQYRAVEVPLHSRLSFSSSRALGSVYLNGSKVKLPVALANASLFRFTVTVKGKALVVNATPVFSGGGEYVRLTVSGRVVDSKHLAPVVGAVVRAYVDGGYAGYAVTAEDGRFLVDSVVRRPRSSRASVTLKVVHEDYEELQVMSQAAVPGAAPRVEVGASASTLILAASAAVIAVAVLAAAARAARAARAAPRARVKGARAR